MRHVLILSFALLADSARAADTYFPPSDADGGWP